MATPKKKTQPRARAAATMPGIRATTPPPPSATPARTTPARTRTTQPRVAVTETLVTDARRAEQLVRDATRLRAEVAVSFYKMGRALRELSKPEIYKSLRYKTFAALLEDRKLPSRVTAFKLITIVGALAEPTARNLGIERSYDAIRYARLASPASDVGTFIARDPRVTVDKKEVPLSTLSTRALAAAVRTLKKKTTPRPDPATKSAARSLAAVLDNAGIDALEVYRHRRATQWIVRIDMLAPEAVDLATLIQEHRRLTERYDKLLAKLARQAKRK